jgi:hypothetical protein
MLYSDLTNTQDPETTAANLQCAEAKLQAGTAAIESASPSTFPDEANTVFQDLDSAHNACLETNPLAEATADIDTASGLAAAGQQLVRTGDACLVTSGRAANTVASNLESVASQEDQLSSDLSNFTAPITSAIDTMSSPSVNEQDLQSMLEDVQSASHILQTTDSDASAAANNVQTVLTDLRDALLILKGCFPGSIRKPSIALPTLPTSSTTPATVPTGAPTQPPRGIGGPWESAPLKFTSALIAFENQHRSTCTYCTFKSGYHAYLSQDPKQTSWYAFLIAVDSTVTTTAGGAPGVGWGIAENQAGNWTVVVDPSDQAICNAPGVPESVLTDFQMNNDC